VDVVGCVDGWLIGMLCSGLLKLEAAIAGAVFSGGGGGAALQRLT
jgi:hypothetical protein